MTDADLRDAEAAEYVIGLMSAAEREAFAARLDTAPEVAQQVEFWAARLASLDAEYLPDTPPARVKQAIDEQLFGGREAGAGGRWRWPLLPTLLAAALAVVMVIVGLQLSPAQPDFVARLDAVEAGYVFQASYDRADMRLTVTPLLGQRPENADFEVWAIGGDGVPVSLGVLPDNGRIEVRRDVAMLPGLTLAISLEPLGGSVTGAPTGPVLSAGVLSDA